MPIASELDNTRRLKSVGFTEAQAEVLAEIVETAQSRGFERFAETLERQMRELRLETKSEFSALRGEIGAVRGEIASLRGELRAELHSSLRDQMLKFITIFSALLGLAIAIIKLFPDVN